MFLVEFVINDRLELSISLIKNCISKIFKVLSVIDIKRLTGIDI